MYRAVTVDDDRWALADMRLSFDFPSFGFTLTGEYKSAEEAYAGIHGDPPDLVITDICMENKSGLELIRACRDERVKSLFVVVSGHEEFEYAREALNQQAFYYMLKPISDREARDVMRRALEYCQARPDMYPLKNDAVDTFGRILLFVRRHYMRQMTLEDIAAAHFINKNYLSQLFTQRTGKTFSQYRNELRIAEAKKLLREGSMSLTDIAASVGYENANYFFRVFSEKTKLTPQQYRNQFRAGALSETAQVERKGRTTHEN